MFKHTKRLLSDIRFWCQELKLRRHENAEWERIEDEDFFFSAGNSHQSFHSPYPRCVAKIRPRSSKITAATTSILFS